MSEHIIIKLPADKGMEIALVLPNGEQVLLQWQTDPPALDLCFLGGLRHLTAWKDDDLTPADRADGHKGQKVKQVCVDFPPASLEKPTCDKHELAQVFPLCHFLSVEMAERRWTVEDIVSVCQLTRERLTNILDGADIGLYEAEILGHVFGVSAALFSNIQMAYKKSQAKPI